MALNSTLNYALTIDKFLRGKCVLISSGNHTYFKFVTSAARLYIDLDQVRLSKVRREPRGMGIRCGNPMKWEIERAARGAFTRCIYARCIMHYARCIVHYHLRGAFTRGALREVHYAFTRGAFTRCIYITASRRARARRENFMSSISIPSVPFGL